MSGWAYLLLSTYAVGFAVHCGIITNECERLGVKLNAWMVLMLIVWPLPAAEAAYEAFQEYRK